MVNEFGGAYGGSAPGESASENVTGTDDEDDGRPSGPPGGSDDDDDSSAGGSGFGGLAGAAASQESDSDGGSDSTTTTDTSDDNGDSDTSTSGGGAPGGLAGVADSQESDGSTQTDTTTSDDTTTGETQDDESTATGGVVGAAESQETDQDIGGPGAGGLSGAAARQVDEPSDITGMGEEDFAEGSVVGQTVSESEAEQIAEERIAGEFEALGTQDVTATVGEGGEVQVSVADRVDISDTEYIPAGEQVGTITFPSAQAAAQEAERQAISQIGDVSEEDVIVEQTDDGFEASLTGQAQAEMASGQIESQLEEQYSNQLLSAYGINPEAASGPTPTLVDFERGEDYTLNVDRRGDGTVSVSAKLTPERQRELAERSISQQLGTQTGQAVNVGRDVKVTQEDGEFSAELTEEGKQRLTQPRERQEEFGDYDLSIGDIDLTDEQAQRRASQQYQSAVTSATGEGGIFGESAIAAGLEYAGYDQAAETIESSGRTLLRGAGQILDPAAVTIAGTELAEYGIYSGQEIVAGRGRQLAEESASELESRISATLSYLSENPVRTVGVGAGALVGSAAIMGAAGRVSSRAGTATRYAIQPGEEIVGSAGFRATRGVAGEARAQQLFPNREPLIFSEEAAIRAARGVGDRVRGLRGVETELSPSPRQQDLIAFGRPAGSAESTIGGETPTGSIEEGSLAARSQSAQRGRPSERSESGTTGAQSEPLGGRSEDVLDRLYGDPGVERTPITPTAQSRRGVSEFLASERGQMQIGRGLGRSKTESDPATERQVPEPEGSFEDVRQDALTQYQDYLGETARTEFEARREQFADFETEAEQRLQRAQGREVRTETETKTRAETETRTETFIDELTRGAVGAEARVGQEPRFDVFQEFDTRLGQEVEFETETEFESEFEAEAEAEAEAETEVEQEFETEAETETRREVFGFPESEEGAGGEAIDAFLGNRGERVTAFVNPLTGERIE